MRDKLFGTTSVGLDLQRDAGRLVALVEDAAIARGAAVSAVMFHMAAIRSLHTGTPHGEIAAIQCVAARVQDRSGTAGYQAAHLVPGAIRVNGRDVWDLVPETGSELVRLQLQVKEAFAETRVLPAAVNRADSMAEGDGSPASEIKLKTLFRAQVQQMWMSRRFAVGRPLAIDRAGVLNALSGWFVGLNRAYEAAAVMKRQQAQVAAGDKAREGRLQEAMVLEAYARSFLIVNVARFVEKEIPAVHHRYAWV